IDLILEEAREATDASSGPEDQAPEPLTGPAVSQIGDLWLLGPHRLRCGDARDKAGYDQLLDSAKVGIRLHRSALQRRDRWSCLRARPHSSS
ncbi:MAG: hypothetical protein WBL81_10635, partial [Pseudolabrys sp.]